MPNILRLIGLLGLVPLVPVLGNDIDDLQKKVNALTARVELLEKHLGMAKVSDAKALNTAPELLNLSELALIGKGKFETFCMACHKHEYSDPMLAPPMATVMDHYKQVLGKNKNKFVDTIVAWVKEPSTEKTLMPGAIRNFNLMPPFVLPDPDLEAIATYLFEAEMPKPGNFEEHLRMERRQLNQGGQGFGQGRGFGGNGRNLSQNQGLHTNTLRESETDSPSGSGHVSIKQSELTELSDLAKHGKSRFELFCTVCHQNDQTATMVAPPMFAVVDHYTKNYGEDKSGFVEAIMDWAKSPDESKSLMPGAIQKFKLMPPFPIPDKDLKAIATYLSEADFTIPGWYDEHYLQEHGEARTGN